MQFTKRQKIIIAVGVIIALAAIWYWFKQNEANTIASAPAANTGGPINNNAAQPDAVNEPAS